ncbi:MAG: aminotransferase class V-fold PLP-dependent enzyme, partial [Proteobacteria bacterium]|nr:aminotransferase class V-fold PLP-dependent enzyme [Pseudomonadota bacterium]
NCSDALSAILFALPQGRLVTTDGHFTTGHYIHQEWARRTNSEVVRVPLDEQECVSTEVLVDSLTADTSIVSLSHAFYRNGYLLDIYAIAEAMMDICPEAALLLDAYQTLGTVPLNVERLPVQTAVLGGGIKQLRCGPGVGFAWVSHLLLERVKADRLGWWAHAEPLAFDQEFRVGAGAAKLRTGTPALMPLVALVTELRVLGSSGDGDLQSAIARARLVTATQVQEAVEYAQTIGLQVQGPTTPDRRAAFFGIRVDGGNNIVAALEEDGVIVDFRPDEPGSESGLIRLSANHASLGYELMFAVEQLRALV